MPSNVSIKVAPTALPVTVGSEYVLVQIHSREPDPAYAWPTVMGQGITMTVTATEIQFIAP